MEALWPICWTLLICLKRNWGMCRATSTACISLSGITKAMLVSAFLWHRNVAAEISLTFMFLIPS